MHTTYLPDLLLHGGTFHAEIDAVLLPFGRRVDDIHHHEEHILGRVLALRAAASH